MGFFILDQQGVKDYRTSGWNDAFLTNSNLRAMDPNPSILPSML